MFVKIKSSFVIEEFDYFVFWQIKKHCSNFICILGDLRE